MYVTLQSHVLTLLYLTIRGYISIFYFNKRQCGIQSIILNYSTEGNLMAEIYEYSLEEINSHQMYIKFPVTSLKCWVNLHHVIYVLYFLYKLCISPQKLRNNHPKTTWTVSPCSDPLGFLSRCVNLDKSHQLNELQLPHN